MPEQWPRLPPPPPMPTGAGPRQPPPMTAAVETVLDRGARAGAPPVLGGPATYLEFARAVRDTHPGAFDDASDEEVTEAILDLHPELGGEIAPPPGRIPRAARIGLPPPPPPDQVMGMAATPNRPLVSDTAEGMPIEGGHQLFGPGLKKAGIGAVRLATGAQSEGGRANAIADMLEGTMEAAMPVVGAAMALNPGLIPEVVLGTLVGVGTDKAAEAALERIGYTQQHPGRARLIRLAAGIASGIPASAMVRPKGALPRPEFFEGGAVRDPDAMFQAIEDAVRMHAPRGAEDYARAADARGGLVSTDFAAPGAPPPPPPRLLPAAGGASRQGVIRVYPSDAVPQLEVTSGQPVIAAGGRLADPPPPPIDVLTEQLGATLGKPVANVPRLNTEKGLHLEYSGPPLPPQAQPLPLRLDKRRKQKAIQGIGTEKIETSPGGAPPTREQPRLPDIPPPPMNIVEPPTGGRPDYVRLDRRTRSGLQWIINELGEFKYNSSRVENHWEGNELESVWHPREAGAPVYHDILQVAGHDFTRNEVDDILHRGIIGGEMTPAEENVFVAAQRIGDAWISTAEAGRGGPRWARVQALDGTTYILKEHALLPPDAAQLPGGVQWLDDLADKLESQADLSEGELAEVIDALAGGDPPVVTDAPPLPPAGTQGRDLQGVSTVVLPKPQDGPPPPPQGVIPGLEDVRSTEVPTPEVGEAPFALEPEVGRSSPLQPSFPHIGQPGFFAKLRGDEGVLILNVPPGDPIGLKQWFGSNRADYGTEPWFKKAEAALAAGDDMRAWRFVAAASARSLAAAGVSKSEQYDRALGGRAVARVKGRIKSVPSAGDPGGKISIVQPPTIPKDLIGEGVTTGAAGTLIPPVQTKSVPAGASDRVLGRMFTNALIEGADPEQVVLHPDMKIRDLQASAQIAEQILMKDIPTGEIEGLTGMDRSQIAAGFRNAMSHAGKQLGFLGNWVQKNADDIIMLREIAGGAPVLEDRTLGVLAEKNFASDRIRALYHTIGRPVKAAMLAGQPEFSGRDLSLMGGISNATIPLMISQPATAVRNLMGQTARYSVAMLDEAMSAGFAAMAGSKEEASLHWARAMEMGKAAARPGIPSSPMNAAQESLEAIFDFTASSWKELPKNDIRRTLRLLLEQPEGADPHLTSFLGKVSGLDEDAFLKIRQSEVPVLKQGVEAVNAFLDPKVQNKFTALNRWQEFSTRAPIFDAQLRAHMTAAGFDPDVLLRLDGPTLRETVGARNFDRWMIDATSTALDYTFASPTLPGSIPDTILNIFSDLPALKIGYPFPRFDIVATMRFLYDHSPVALVDNVFRGIPYAFGGRPRTRLQMGMVAKDIAEKYIPELDGKLTAQQDRFGDAIQSLHESHGAVRRLVADSKRLAAEGTPEEMQTSLELEKGYLDQARQRAESLKGAIERQKQQPGILADTLGADEEALARATAEVQQHRSLVTTLERRIANRAEKPIAPADELKVSLEDAVAETERRTTEAKDAQRAIRWLEIQQGWLEKGYRDYKAIGAPTLPEFMGRQAVGALGLFGGAYAIRSSAGAEGTEWYQYRLGSGENAVIADLRPFGPYVQALFVADVIRDHQTHTDWKKVAEEVGGLDNANPFAWADAVRNNYDGKYSNTKLGREFAHAFLTISRAAGVTLTIADFASRWVTGQAAGVDAFSDMVLGTIGQMAARTTIPLRPVKDLLSVAFPEEATVRIPDRPSDEQPYSPLAAPLQNVPFAGQLIPPSVSQITGEELTSKNPIGRQFAGLSTTQQTALQRVFSELGVLPESIYIHRTGDRGLDNEIAKEYSKQLRENPAFLSIFEPSGPFMSISSIGLKREVMSSVLSGMKQLTIFNVRQSLGIESTEEKFRSPAELQRRRRWQAELDRMQAQAESGQPPPPEFDPSVPDQPAGGPPAPPQ